MVDYDEASTNIDSIAERWTMVLLDGLVTYCVTIAHDSSRGTETGYMICTVAGSAALPILYTAHVRLRTTYPKQSARQKVRSDRV